MIKVGDTVRLNADIKSFRWWSNGESAVVIQIVRDRVISELYTAYLVETHDGKGNPHRAVFWQTEIEEIEKEGSDNE